MTLDATIPHARDTAPVPMLDREGDDMAAADEMESTTHAMTLLLNMTAEIPCSVVAESWKNARLDLAASSNASKIPKMVPVAMTSCILDILVALTSAEVLPVAMVHSMNP